MADTPRNMCIWSCIIIILLKVTPRKRSLVAEKRKGWRDGRVYIQKRWRQHEETDRESKPDNTGCVSHETPRVHVVPHFLLREGTAARKKQIYWMHSSVPSCDLFSSVTYQKVFSYNREKLRIRERMIHCLQRSGRISFLPTYSRHRTVNCRCAVCSTPPPSRWPGLMLATAPSSFVLRSLTSGWGLFIFLQKLVHQEHISAVSRQSN